MAADFALLNVALSFGSNRNPVMQLNSVTDLFSAQKCSMVRE